MTAPGKRPRGAGRVAQARSTKARRRIRRSVTTRRAKPIADASFLVVTGLSGAGKSHAIRALEDLGYYCVDNLPTALIPVLADLAIRADSLTSKVAVVVDVRERRFLDEFPVVWKRLESTPGLQPVLIFLEANEQALLRRYSETRRPHPLAPNRPIAEALREEREMLASIRATAHEIIDTSDLTVHELRQLLQSMVRGGDRARLMVTFESFGFKNGVPLDADLVFDCRFLPNPHFVDELKNKSGKDRAVGAYLRRHTLTKDFVERLASFLNYVVPHYVAEGKAYLTVAIGCTGGQHRSVYLAEELKRELSGLQGVTLRVRHRDLPAIAAVDERKKKGAS